MISLYKTVMITHGTTLLYRCREMDFLKKVHETVEKGGKVSESLEQQNVEDCLFSNQNDTSGS